MSWSRVFDEPIHLPSGRELVTLRDAGEHIAALPKKEHAAPEWQAAMEALILVAEGGGLTLFARIGIMRGLNRLLVQTQDGPLPQSSHTRFPHPHSNR
jgi:hypothetical protein